MSPSGGLVPPSLLPALLSLALTISRGAPGTASSLLVEAVEVAAYTDDADSEYDDGGVGTTMTLRKPTTTSDPNLALMCSKKKRGLV